MSSSQTNREELKAAFKRVYERENANLDRNSEYIKNKMKLSSILILFGTVLIILTFSIMFYFQVFTNPILFLLIITFVILGLLISVRVPLNLSKNLSELQLQLDSSSTKVQLNSVLGAVFIGLVIIGTMINTTQLETTDTEFETYELNDFVTGVPYIDNEGNSRVDVLVVVNGPPINMNNDNVIIQIESWFAGNILEVKTTKLTANFTVKESIRIHELDDTSINTYIKVNNLVVDSKIEPGKKDLYISNAEVKVKGIFKNKAEVTVTAYNEGAPRQEGTVTITVYSSSILGSEHKESTANDVCLEANEDWETTITINIDYFEGEETALDVYLEFRETEMDKERLIIE